MVNQRNRSVNIIQYLQTLGIEVNIGKNKARGHKGIFMTSDGKYRIDISKDLPDENRLGVIIHEFSHYIHFKKDKSLNSLKFIFEEFNEELENELINITVQNIPKEFASSMFERKDITKRKIKELSSIIKEQYPDFKLSEPYKKIEKELKNPVKYLLKYDRVRVFTKIFSVNELESEFPNLTTVQAAYIRLKSKQRLLQRINSKISKINKYYNKPAELFARFVEMFFTNPVLTQRLAPKAFLNLRNAIDNNKIPELTAFASFF